VLFRSRQGNLYPDARNLRAFAASRAFSSFVGTNDELFGWSTTNTTPWTGPQGVADFAAATALQCTVPDCSDNPSAVGSRAVTFYAVPGATHSNTWDFTSPDGTYIPFEICRKMAYDLHPTWSQARRNSVCNGTST
jgi:hypothetical protein